MARYIPIPTPGEILLEEFLKPMDLSVYALAKAVGVTRTRLNEVVHGKRAITPDTALRLARYFGMSAEFWINLQVQYDLDMTREALTEELKAIQPRRDAA